MIKACDLKEKMVVDIGGTPHIAERVQVQTPSARGAATLYKIRFRNVLTRQKIDQSLKGDDPFREIDLERREAQFLYRKHDLYTFMDLTDYSQFALATADIEDAAPYLIDNMEGILALVSGDRVLGIEMPPSVILEVVECDPAVRGASVTARTKAARLTTGLAVQVPEYLSAGESIRVDTRTGKFIARA